jgi:hypothetical protein
MKTSSGSALRERVVEAAPFDQVAIVRCLTEELPPWPADMSIEGQDPTSGRLATLLSTVWDQPPNLKLDSPDAGELARLLFPIALSDQGLVPLIQDAAELQPYTLAPSRRSAHGYESARRGIPAQCPGRGGRTGPPARRAPDRRWRRDRE